MSFLAVFGFIVIPFHSVSFGYHFATTSVQLSFNLDFGSHHHQLCASHEPENKLHSRAKAVAAKKKKTENVARGNEMKCLLSLKLCTTGPLPQKRLIRKNACSVVHLMVAHIMDAHTHKIPE